MAKQFSIICVFILNHNYNRKYQKIYVCWSCLFDRWNFSWILRVFLLLVHLPKRQLQQTPQIHLIYSVFQTIFILCSVLHIQYCSVHYIIFYKLTISSGDKIPNCRCFTLRTDAAESLHSAIELWFLCVWYFGHDYCLLERKVYWRT